MSVPFSDNNALRAYCLPFLRGQLPPETAEELMASRYVAYTLGEIDYLVATTDPQHAEGLDRKAMASWAADAEWLGLEILKTAKGGVDDSEGEVEFVAHFKMHGQRMKHHEHSTFKRISGRWFFSTGRAVSP